MGILKMARFILGLQEAFFGRVSKGVYIGKVS